MEDAVTSEEEDADSQDINIQGGREISAILLTIVGDGWKDQYIYIQGVNDIDCQKNELKDI